MDYFIPGTIVRVKDLSGGDCVLFGVANKMHVGVVIKLDDGVALLDLDSEEREGRENFVAYRSHSFANDDILRVDTAKVVPLFDAETMGHGYPNGSHVSRVLFIADSEPVVQFEYERSLYSVKLTDGTFVQTNLGDRIHFKNWTIEYTGTDGDPAILWMMESEPVAID